MIKNQQILRQAQLLEKYAIQCRRTIHCFAEPSGAEFKTSLFIQQEMASVGIPFKKVSTTGLIGTLDTGRSGPHIVLRADMDALPIVEAATNLVGPRVCISDHSSTCHACGHDAHVAMLLAAMKALADCRDQLIGSIYFCFEEGEETGSGISGMLEALSKEQIDTCWAIHVYAGLESGKICVDSGPRMSGAAKVGIQVFGKGGHASRPDMTDNPVFCAASVIANAATCWVNQISANKTVTLGISSILGGSEWNIIPDFAKILGTIRFFDREEGQKAILILKSVAEHTAAMHRCHVEFAPDFAVLLDPVVNNAAYSRMIKEGLTELLPNGAVTSCEPWYASESYSRYAQKYPSIMAHLGINHVAKGYGAPHHNSFFDVDESVLRIGVISTLKFVEVVQKHYGDETGN